MNAPASNWKYNIGTALSTLGHSLGGAAGLSLGLGASNHLLGWTAFTGFVTNALGDFLSKLFPNPNAGVVHPVIVQPDNGVQPSVPPPPQNG